MFSKVEVRIENAGDTRAQELARVVGRDQRGERVAALEEDLGIRAGVVERQMTMRVDEAGHHGHALDVELLDATLMYCPLVGVGSNGGDLAVLDEYGGRVRISAGAVNDSAVLDQQGGVHSGLLISASFHAQQAPRVLGQVGLGLVRAVRIGCVPADEVRTIHQPVASDRRDEELLRARTVQMRIEPEAAVALLERALGTQFARRPWALARRPREPAKKIGRGTAAMAETHVEPRMPVHTPP